MRWLMVALALTLGGCTSELIQARARSDQAYKTFPQNHRSDIVLFMRTYLNDPSNVRDALISEPALRTLEEINRYSVCLRYNARKSGGQYAGSRDSIVLFRDGRLDRVIDNDRVTNIVREQCKDAAYQPFPELEQMTR